MKCELSKYGTFDEEGCTSICSRCKNSELSIKSFITWIKNLKRIFL